MIQRFTPFQPSSYTHPLQPQELDENSRYQYCVEFLTQSPAEYEVIDLIVAISHADRRQISIRSLETEGYRVFCRDILPTGRVEVSGIELAIFFGGVTPTEIPSELAFKMYKKLSWQDIDRARIPGVCKFRCWNPPKPKEDDDDKKLQ